MLFNLDKTKQCANFRHYVVFNKATDSYYNFIKQEKNEHLRTYLSELLPPSQRSSLGRRKKYYSILCFADFISVSVMCVRKMSFSILKGIFGGLIFESN